jgi:hypothetical protein
MRKVNGSLMSYVSSVITTILGKHLTSCSAYKSTVILKVKVKKGIQGRKTVSLPSYSVTTLPDEELDRI